VNVLLGIFVLSERLNRMQWTAVALAAGGVAYLTLETGHIPWAALIVAMSFALYGLIRKTANVEALPGLAIELTLLLPISIAYLLWCQLTGIGAMGHSGLTVDLLFVFGGPATAIPLFLFSYGARRIPYSTVGVLQYIGPTGQLACAIWYFGEHTIAYRHGKPHDNGTWQAGKHGNMPGVALPAEPKVGLTYREEYSKDLAEDQSRVLVLDEQVKVGAGHFKPVLMTEDFSPIEPNVSELKFYAHGSGQAVLAVDVSGGSDREELIAYHPGG